MGIFSLFKKGVSGYSDSYDYRIDVILKCVDILLDGDIGDLRKIKSGNDWVFGGGTIRGLMGTQVLNDSYFDYIDNCWDKGISLDECVKQTCQIINKKDFIRACDNYANRPFI